MAHVGPGPAGPPLGPTALFGRPGTPIRRWWWASPPGRALPAALRPRPRRGPDGQAGQSLLLLAGLAVSDRSRAPPRSVGLLPLQRAHDPAISCSPSHRAPLYGTPGFMLSPFLRPSLVRELGRRLTGRRAPSPASTSCCRLASAAPLQSGHGSSRCAHRPATS